MTDQLSTMYAEQLAGTYECPDRIVLNAYYRPCTTAGGLRCWWRSLHGDDSDLDKTRLVRMAGRFNRRVKAYAAAHQIPLIYCNKGSRKHEIAEQHLPQDQAFVGLFLVIISRASGAVWNVERKRDGSIKHISRSYRSINHIFFHFIDPQWGHITIRMSSHPPFAAMVILNGHEYIARQAQAQGVDFEQSSNCFTSIMNPTDLAQIAETSCAAHTIGQLRQVCNRWIYSGLYFAMTTEEQERSGFRYTYALFQIEYSRNFLFHIPAQMEQVYNALLDRSRTLLDIPQLKTIFGRSKRPYRKKADSTHPIIEERSFERPRFNMSIFKLRFGALVLKLYTKGEAVLRSEITVNNARRIHCKYSLAHVHDLLAYLRGILLRFLDQLAVLSAAFVHDDTLDLIRSAAMLGKSSVAGIDLQQPRIRAVMHAVIALAPQPRGFSASQLASHVRQRLQLEPQQYLPRQAAYDLRKLRAKSWVDKVAKSRRYEPNLDGLRSMTSLLLLHEQVRKPLFSASHGSTAQQPKTDLDIQYGNVQREIHQLFSLLGFALV